MKRLTMLFLMLVAAAGLTGCNTARGFGADLELLGKAIKNSGKKEESTTATTAPAPTQYPAEETAVSQPYQDPAYSQPVEGATGTTYSQPVQEVPATTYPEYK